MLILILIMVITTTIAVALAVAHIALINYPEDYCSNSPLICSRSLEMRVDISPDLAHGIAINWSEELDYHPKR